MLQKLGPRFIKDLTSRVASLKSIDEKLGLGNGLTLAAFEEKVNLLISLINEYNTDKSSLDGKRTTIYKLIPEVKDFSERMLLTIGGIHGRNSEEYVKAGGTKKDDIKKTKRSTEKKE